MEGTNLIKLDKSEESYNLLKNYYYKLDKEFVPALSTYVDIDSYTEKLIEYAYVAVLMKDEELVGTFSIYINDPKKETAFISSLAISKEYIGTGYGPYMFDLAFAVAREAGFSYAKYEIRKEDKRSHRFHEKIGSIELDEDTGNPNTFYMHMPLTKNNGDKE